MSQSSRLGYLPALDGLRGVALVAILLYHAQQSMPSSSLPGGFLSLEVFFVLSGYLITALLVTEFERSGTIGLRQFWVRRARRLLPALCTMLVVTMAIVGFAGARSDSVRAQIGRAHV